MDLIWSVSFLFLRTQDGIAEQVLEYPIHRLSQLKKLKFNSQTRICYFIGRNCHRKKMWGKSCNLGNFFFSNNIIFQFATFSSCNLYSKGSNRCLLLIGLLIDVSCLSVFSHTPYSTHPYPCLLFFRICLSQKNFFICTEWYTCIEWYTCNIIKQFLKQFVWWLKSGQSYLPWILGCFLTQGKNQLLFPFQEEGLCNSYL